VNGTPSEVGLAVLEMARAGRFDEVHDLFAPQLRPMVTTEALEQGWNAELERLGPIVSVGEPITEAAPSRTTVVKIPIGCERGSMTLVISLAAAGELVGIQLAPSSAAKPTATWEPPSYASPKTFDEHDVTLGSGRLAVPGTLSLPRGSGPHPALILLAGSGPMDRDESIGPNKAFKDLAWCLASRGMAVLRFDKVTLAHPNNVRQKTDFTSVEEYAPAAAAGAKLLSEHHAIDRDRIFLLGHSFGGTVAPRVATGEGFAGIIILAGGAEPLHWSAVRQVRYLASLSPETANASAAVVETMTNQASMFDNPELSLSTPTAELPFGVPAAYWLDLRAYDPIAVAAALDCPILILQGGRDYQATVEGDLERWKDGLAHRSNVTVRVYPSDNHMFFSGSGLSSPAEYESTHHVDRFVVADIAAWVLTGAVESPADEIQS
jgi:hypothetical protein